MTSKLHIAQLRLYVYQMKASNLGNQKNAKDYKIDLLMTSYKLPQKWEL